ncbi:MAG: adenosylcobinamide-phosphate synthase CbiB [Desulfobacterota bacterium]|nr:adenosylcobinamide-phosphate synthase CbiB [Thermodesulfobacteriota bacterium]
MPHPVKAMGKVISFLDKRMNVQGKKTHLYIKGGLMAIFVILLFGTSTATVLYLAQRLDKYVGTVLDIIISYFVLSTRDLYDHGIEIYRRLKANDLVGAKKALSMIVGRDVEHMDEKDIVKSAVESIAENTNDGVVAPLFYLILGGPVLAMVYKAINTLDSMVGYKDERYEHFGFFSAKLDDIFGYIPARLSAIFISISSLIYYRSFKAFHLSVKTFIKQGSYHPSPNSGYPEAAMAGALGMRISGPQYYGGKLSIKPYIGEERRKTKPELIREALHIMLLSSILTLISGVLLRGI